MRKRPPSHYDYLDEHFVTFLRNLGIAEPERYRGMIVAHGDKCTCDRYSWEKGGLHYFHGVAIYLLTYIHPYNQEVRDVGGRWVAPKNWVLANRDRFLPHLPPLP